MLPSSQKVSQELFKSLIKKGRRYVSASFSATFFLNEPGQQPKFSVVVSKKVEKTAVKRNYMKRVVYVLLRRFIDGVNPGTVCAIFLRKKLIKTDLETFAGELKTFLDKSHLLS